MRNACLNLLKLDGFGCRRTVRADSTTFIGLTVITYLLAADYARDTSCVLQSNDFGFRAANTVWTGFSCRRPTRVCLFFHRVPSPVIELEAASFSVRKRLLSHPVILCVAPGICSRLSKSSGSCHLRKSWSLRAAPVEMNWVSSLTSKT